MSAQDTMVEKVARAIDPDAWNEQAPPYAFAGDLDNRADRKQSASRRAGLLEAADAASMEGAEGLGKQLASIANGPNVSLNALRDVLRNAATALLSLQREAGRCREALEEIERHHVAQNQLKGRDEARSKTLRLARAALQPDTTVEKAP